MKHALRKIIYACSLLLILLSALVGQKVHIYTEDPLHFEAFCRDLVPDNGAEARIVELCVVDNYVFFPCVCVDTLVLATSFIQLAEQAEERTRAKLVCAIRLAGLRAPPARI